MGRESPAGPTELTQAEMLEIVDRVWDAFDRRDWDAWFSNSTPDVTMKTDPLWPGGGSYTGRDEIMRFTAQFLDPWEDLRFERRGEGELVEGRLVLPAAWIGRGRATGIDGRIDYTMVLSFREGLVARADYFINHEDALEFARGYAG